MMVSIREFEQERKRREEQGHEDIVLQERKGKYDEPWIKEYIIEERNQNKTWEEIVNGLKERGLDKITAQTCSKLYKESLARTLTTSTEAKDDFIEFTKQLKDIYKDSITLMGEYVKALRRINQELLNIKVTEDDDKTTLLQTQMSIAKQIPLATGLMKEVREYVKNQISLYDTIQETKEEDVVWSEAKMLSYVNEFLPIYLKQQDELGTIRILDKSILKVQ